MNSLSDPIHGILEAYKAAVYARNLDAFAAIYADQVEAFDAWDRWAYVGIDDWRNMASAWFKSLGSDRVVVDFNGLRSRVDGNLATGHAFLTFTAVSCDGRRLRSIENRVTLVAANDGFAWKVVHEHTSSPADFQSKTVLIRRLQHGT